VTVITPDVTIIVTTFDRASMLDVSLHSILASAAVGRQAGIRTRVLVVDDGSPNDETRTVAERLGVDYLRIPENSGRGSPSFGRVAGLREVDSPFHAFFDDDDVMLPRWIPSHVEALHAGADVCSTAFWRTDADFRITKEIRPDLATLGYLLSGRNPINDQSLIRRSALAGIEWEPELDNVMVLPVWLELAFRGSTFRRLDEPTFLHRRHDQNTSDHLDSTDASVRRSVIERYKARVLARDGKLPEPTPRAARPPSPARPRRPLWRRAVSAARHALRG
jgi:glycosyltransferase involved in cell wall biosynthesis